MMRKKTFILRFLILGICSLLTVQLVAQEQKVVLITLDGFRWQELFGGMDSTLLDHEKYTKNRRDLKNRYWRETREERREALLPFLWKEVAPKGVIYGNRWEESIFNVTNKMWFSYPGYNEILTGYADDEHITSNNKIYNVNKTVFEVINEQPEFNGKVLAFGSWELFPFIFNEERSQLPVNGGFRHSLSPHPTEKELVLNKIQDETPVRWPSVRYDTFTHNYAMEALKTQKPRLLFVGYGETDDFAHNGDYDHYMHSANVNDRMIQELWDYLQSDPYYKDQTTLLITTDHGRESGVDHPGFFRDHGSATGADSYESWMILFGNQIDPSKYEVKGVNGANQVAATIAELLGVTYQPKRTIGKSLLK